MRYLLTILTILMLCSVAFGQPGGYTTNTRANWSFNGRAHPYIRPSNWIAGDPILIWGRGDGETTYANLSHTVSKWINDAGPNWDANVRGSINRPVLVIELLNIYGANYDLIEADIAYIFQNHSPAIDTSDHSDIFIGGLSGGTVRTMAVLTNYYGNSLGYDWPYRHVFGSALFLSSPGAIFTFDFSYISTAHRNANLRTMWGFGTADGGLTAPVHSYTGYAGSPGTAGVDKFIDSIVGGTHSDNTWDPFLDSNANNKGWPFYFGTGNASPNAVAGSDQSLGVGTTSTTVDGSGSNDPDGTISTYLWTRISGPNTPTITNPGNASTTITSMIAGTYVFRLTVTDNGGATGTDDISITISSPSYVKITGINWRDVVNMAGGYNPSTMFDENANIDPANGDISPVPTTMSLPSGKNLYSIYQNSESRFYVKLRGNFDLTALYIHCPALGTYFGDSLVVYKGLHTPDDPLTPADRIATVYVAPSTAGWVFVPLSGANAQDVSIITFGFKGNPDPTPGFETIATRFDATEFVLYGDQDGSRSAALPTTLTYAHRPKKTLKEIIGINNGSGYINMVTIPDSTDLRSLIDVGFIPGNNADWPSNTFNQNPFGDWPTLPYRTERYYWDSVARIKGGRVHPEFFHTTTRAESQGAGSEYWAVDNLGDNPDLPASYEIFADLGWHYAKMYGRLGVISDTLNYKTYGVPKYAGLDLIGRIGFDNESDYLSRKIDTASDNDFKYSSVYQVAVKGSMFYDGHVGAYGPRLGVKTADSTVEIVGPGTIGLLGQRYHDLTTYIKDMRSDGKNFIKYAAAHIYPNNDYLGVVPPYGIHPVEFGKREKVQAYVDSIRTIDSSMIAIITEDGFDANDSIVFGNRSQYAVPDTSALTTREKQANLTAYTFFTGWATNIEEIDEFELFNNNSESNNGSYQTSNDAKNLPSLTLMPKYYFKKQMIAIMGDYIHDSVISEQWRVSMVYRGHNKYDTSLKCYVVSIPNNGGLTGNITVNVGIGSTVTEYDMSFSSTTPSTTTRTVDGSGNVSIPASDKPKILIVQTQGASLPALQTNWRL